MGSPTTDLTQTMSNAPRVAIPSNAGRAGHVPVQIDLGGLGVQLPASAV